jgi:hypothetical protein
MFHLRTIAQRLLLPLLFVSGVAAGLTACSDDDENAAIPKEEPNENEDSVRTVDVSFDLSLSAIDTRADETTTTTDSTEYLNGTYAENCIDKTKLFFYTFKDNSHGYDDIWTAKKIRRNKNQFCKRSEDINLQKNRAKHLQGIRKANPTERFRCVRLQQ